jgi:hypothetical protein
MSAAGARPGERFLVEAARAHALCCEEYGALCEVCGLAPASAQRLATLLGFLARETRVPLRLGPPGCRCASADEVALCHAVGAMQTGAPWLVWPVLDRWLPARRRVQGIALLALAASDLASAGLAFAREGAR